MSDPPRPGLRDSGIQSFIHVGLDGTVDDNSRQSSEERTLGSERVDIQIKQEAGDNPTIILGAKLADPQPTVN